MKKNKWIKLLATGISITLLSAMVIGCSGQPSEESSSSAKNKTLTLATGAELTTLYPLNMDPQNDSATKLVYEGLVTYDQGKIKPLLAESWQFNRDGTELTLVLKQGVKFHDGADFNAEAVKKNLEFFHLNPNHRALKAVANLKKAEIIDNYTIKLHYDNPYFAYLNDLCYPEVLVMVSPNVIEDGNFQTMKGVVGTGPYIYKTVKEGESVQFVRNENYWGKKPYYDEVIAKYIHEPASRLQALQNGEIDMMYGNVLISYDDYQQAISMPDIKGKISNINSETRNLAINASSTILSDLNIRQAIAFAIDKKTIASGLTNGYEEVADTLFDPSIPYTNVKLNNERNFDKTKAQSLLDRAGWKLNKTTGIREKNGKPLKLTFTYDSGEALNKSMAVLIKSQLGEVGIDVKTVGQDMYTWWKEGIAGNYDLTIWCTEQPYSAPHNFFTPMLDSSPHVPAIASLSDGSEFTSAIKEFSTTNDEKRVGEIFAYLINYSNDKVLNIPLTYVKDMIVFNKNKINDYDFTSTPKFFDISQIEAK